MRKKPKYRIAISQLLAGEKPLYVVQKNIWWFYWKTISKEYDSYNDAEQEYLKLV